MNHMQRALSLSLLSSVLLSACSGGGGGGDGNGSVSGSIAFVAAASLSIGESEPNDAVDMAQDIGVVAPGTRLVVRGELSTDEVLDAFTVRVPERAAVVATLTYDGAPDRELFLGVYDPISMRLVGRGEANATDALVDVALPATVRRHATARVDGRGVFDFVVRARAEGGAYSLAIRAVAADPVARREGWIGAFSVGDARTCATDGSGRWSVTAVEAQTLVIDVPAGHELRVRDAANGVDVLATGKRRVEVPALAHVELSTSASAPFAFALTSEAPVPVASARTLGRVARVEVERDAWNVSADLVPYGRTTLEAMPGELLVRTRAGANTDATYERRAGRVKDRIPGIADVVELVLPPSNEASELSRVTLATARSLALSPDVEYAELNLIRRAQGGPVTPNDTFYALQWHYPLMRLPEAWGAMTGTTNAIVAVLDTGERTHVDLNANTIAGFDFISSSTIAADGDGRDADPTDEGDGQGPTPSSFHGTHVAGTIGAVTNNGSGVAGVCGPGNRTRIMHLRVLGKGGGTDADIAQAILYAARLANASGLLPATRADVINLSLGGPGSTASVQSAVNAAVGAGVTIVAAAGNNNSGVAFFPASYANVISVAAVDINSVKAPYSNFNATVDLCAPGGDTSVDLNADTYPDGVLSTLVNEATGNPNFVFYQGTSMACPHVAGLAALMKTQNSALTPAQIEAHLKNTATDLGAVGQDPIYGVGLVNAYQAVVAAGGSGSGSPLLAVTPSTLAFGTTATQLTTQIVNLGGGTLDVGTVTDNAPWLTVTEIASAGTSSDVGSVRCTVDRTGLAAGNYSATVTVPASNSTPTSVAVTVTMTVETAPVLVDVELFVLAVDAETFETVAQVVVNPTTGLDYAFTDLPAGSYVIVAGSDEDPTDGGICGPNDIYCGLYPTVNEPEVVTTSESDLTGFDFVVAPADAGGVSTSVPQRVYSRLR